MTDCFPPQRIAVFYIHLWPSELEMSEHGQYHWLIELSEFSESNLCEYSCGVCRDCQSTLWKLAYLIRVLVIETLSFFFPRNWDSCSILVNAPSTRLNIRDIFSDFLLVSCIIRWWTWI
jgi:hypothetical protein